ncbi:MAG TPA: baseplate J/gp47 family protein [Bacilli bacterium]|nr:baseplate J/gp47 family protein [Bacilli bacterium]
MNNLNLIDIERLPIDFEEIVELLKNRVQARLPNRWTDFLASNFGVELLEAFAYEATLMNYYLNMSVNECFLPTAKTKTGVYSLAKTIGYNPSPPSQSIVTLKFYLDNPHSRDIIIPKYTIVTSRDGIPFYTTENKVLYSGETNILVEAKSGTLVEESFISTGEPRRRYKLRQFPVSFIELLTINDEIYTRVDFIDAPGQGKYFTVDYDSEFYAYISFGDGNYGINPAKNLIVNVLYVVGVNSKHNVMPFQITTINDFIFDSENNVVSNIKVINEQNAVGASNGESIDEVKRNAPSIYRTQSRCVTRQDFEDIALTIPGVDKVSVIDNSMMDEIGIFGVKVCVIPKDQKYPTESFKNYIKNILEEKKIVSTQVDVIDPTFIPYDVNINININPNLSSSIISNKIREVVNNYLSYKNRDFGEEVSKQELYRLISNISEINTIHNLTVDENRSIYITEVPSSNRVRFVDNINMLKAGAVINILNLNKELALTTKIIDINEELSEAVIEDNITTDMNIGFGSLIYPVLETSIDHTYGEKEINFKVNYLSGGQQIDFALMNFSNITIYFSDLPNKYYKVLYKISNKLYLSEPIDRDIPSNTKIIIVNKKYVPTLKTNVPRGSDTLLFTDYPRFSKGTELVKNSMISFIPDTIMMIKSGSTVDYIGTAMDLNYLTKINKIYINKNIEFEENLDYKLVDNGRIIEWTTIGRTKITPNTKFYIDIIKKVVNTSDTDLIYYVKSVDKKKVIITPTTAVKMDELTTFDYTTETYVLLPNEIADVGIVNITVI